MISIAEITILITIQVLPKYNDNSVIPFVSISINPAPRKKHGNENLRKEIPDKFFT